MGRVFVATALVAFSIASGAQAAQINQLQGGVSINRGTGFRPVTGATQGNTGDRIMVTQTGRAEIVYDNGCKVIVEPGQVATIMEFPTCDAALVPNSTFAVGVAVIGVGVGIAVLVNNDDDKSKPASP